MSIDQTSEIVSLLGDIEDAISKVRGLITAQARQMSGNGCAHVNAVRYASMGGRPDYFMCPECDSRISTTGAVMPPQGG